MNLKILLLAIIPLALIPTGIAFGNHIFDNNAFAQYLDIAQLTAEKYALKIDEKSYDIYYGYHGSMEVDVNKPSEELPKLSSMNINAERKSIEVTMESVSSDSVLWLRLPLELISAENAQYKLLLDGVDTPYDLTKFPQDYAIGMIMPKDTKHIEIIGSQVIPEFGIITMMILTASVMGVIVYSRTRL